MSTPHKLNVTFWDMPERPNNGYATKITEKNKKFNLFLSKYRFASYTGIGCVICLLTCALDMNLMASVTLPFMAVAVVHFWHAVMYKGSLSNEMSHGLFCASILGEIVGGTAVTGFANRTVIHLLVLMLTGALLGQEPTLVMYAGSRLFLWSCLPWFPEVLRAVLSYVSALSGVIAAKYVENVFVSKLSSEIKLATPRRRRTSNNTLYSIYKVRRTSLPALGGSNKSVHGAFGFQGSASTVDVALLAEAHGLVTDMLADPQLPAHVVGGLRSLASLLAPPSQVALNHRVQRPGGASVSLADFNSGSDNEEIPYTGEKPSALSKRFRRNLPPSLLRRMSTSTWTTTTSATGLPTLEPEPSRKRSTSFRHPTDSQNTSPRGGSSPSTGCAISPSRSQLVSPPSCSKGRSYSTTSIPSSSLSRRNSRDRKTVCSLHPLTSAEIEALHRAHDVEESQDDLQLFQMRMVSRSDADAETTEDDEEGGQPLPPLPCIRRVNITSDYESSNESPGSSDNNDVVLSETDRLPKSLAVQTASQDVNRCTLCGGKTRHGVSIEASSRSQNFDDITPSVQEDEDDTPGLLVNGHRFNLESLDADPLLNRINEWDYPIFELKEQAKDLILSQMCYKVFQEVGLFEAFKIPIQEFLNYFHALESGYREKPYHNRMHAADVLHGVYYLTSQPIPGFTQIPSDATDSPLHKNADSCSSGSGSAPVHRPSFAADASYGVMGANYPALELMALYAAAAMHDYDHPGRTNAFLVSTYAPQAVLYNDRSVLENHHAASAWSLFLSRPEYNFLCHLDKAEFKRFRFLVIECILATDLKRHFEILAEFNAKANEDDAPGIDWMSETDRLLAMEMCIKLADINGPCKRHDIHVQWTHRIAEEFYEQGDEEAELGLQVSPFMDRDNPQLAKLQESFINHLVAPLCNAYGESALLPGVWVEDSESGDDEEVADQTESPTVKFTDDEAADSEGSAPSATTEGARPLRNRKVSCLQTTHIRENYEYWVEILTREQAEKEKQEAAERKEEEAENEVQCQEDEMETIEEEGTIQRLSPTKDDC